MSFDVEQAIEQIKKEENVINKAKLLRFLTVDKQMRVKDIAVRIGMKESYICHILRLNKLTDMIVDGYYSKMISISHLFIISRLHSEKDIMNAYEKVLAENLSVGQTEELVREMLYNTKTVGEHLPQAEIKQVANALHEADNQITLKVIQTRVKGKIILEVRGNLSETSLRLKTYLSKLTADIKGK